MKSVVLAGLVAAASAQQTYQQGYIQYSTVTGYFLQDQTTTNTSGFDYTAVNFGLINQTYPGISSSGLTQWQQFSEVVDNLNENTPADEVYKVFWLGRHGEGYHNAAESFYGTPAWNCYWSELDGNATATWADADLTPNGIKQAQIANAFWKSQIANQKIPRPQSYYTSPLTRCLRTANLTFSDIPTKKYYPFVPEVKEFFREGISTHTCDRRSNKTYIHSRFPTYTFEAGFAETDELWNANYAETSSAQDRRSKAALDSVFVANDHTYISVTSHSGEIASLLRVLGHRAFSLSTGAVIPVLVKAQFLPAASAPVISSAPARTSSAFCTALPVASISGGACVCPGASTGIASSSIRSPSVPASTGAISKTTAASSRLPVTTGSASISKPAVLPSASSSRKAKACKSKSKSKAAASSSKKAKACKSKSRSKLASASTGGMVKPSSSGSRISSGVKFTSVTVSSNVRSASASGSLKSSVVVISKTAASTGTATKPSSSGSKKPKVCKTRKSKTASASTGAVVKPSSSGSRVSSGIKSTSAPASSGTKTTSALASSGVKSAPVSSGIQSSTLLTSKTAASTGGAVKPSGSVSSSTKPRACKTRKSKTLSASTGGVVKPSTSSVSGAKNTGTATLSSVTPSAVKSTSTSVADVKSSSSALATSVSGSSSAAANKSSSANSSVKPASTGVSSKTSAASSVTTSSVRAASLTATSTTKAKACKTKTYSSYYNEYTP